MKKERIKQIILSGIAFSLIIVGCLNYNFESEKTVEVSSEANEINIGDVQLVNSEPEISNKIDENKKIEYNKYEEAIVPNGEEEKKKEYTDYNSNTTNENNNIEDNYFTETRLERERMNSEMIDTYQKMLNSSEISSEQKAIASQEISKITNIKNGIMISENLIKNKGFQDVVILVSNDIVSVIVKSNSLNQEQIAQIQNIVSRELKINVENINISSK